MNLCNPLKIKLFQGYMAEGGLGVYQNRFIFAV